MLGFWDGHLWQWTISWECAFSPRDAFEYSKLVLLLNEVVLSSFEEDYLIWAPSKVGLFSVKSTLLELHKSSCPLTQISSKVYGAASFPIEFKSSHGYCSFKKINIKEKLARIGIIPQSNVVWVFCHLYIEYVSHLFLHCEFSWQIWVWWLDMCGLQWILPFHIKAAFLQWRFKKYGPFFKNVWWAIFFIILWFIWKERNTGVFCNKASSQNDLRELILLRLGWLIKGWNDQSPFSAEEIARSPCCLQWKPPPLKPPLKSLMLESLTVSWAAPPLEWIKWNVDASFDNRLNHVVVGGVLRDG